MRSSGNGLAHQISKLFKELVERELRSIEQAIDTQKRELHERINARETELRDDGGLDARFENYKAGLSKTERPENRVQERRLYYNWEGRLRSELGSWRIELAELEDRVSDPEAVMTGARRKVMRLLLRETLVAVNPGYNNTPTSQDEVCNTLEDCLIPVIQQMKLGKSHMEAFRMVAEELGIRKTSVVAQCTDDLDLTTEQFVEYVANGRIVRAVKNKFPEQSDLIGRKLAPLYP